MNNYLTFLILGVVFIYYIVNKVIPSLKNSSKATKGVLSKIYLNRNSNIDDSRYKKIALGAIYSEQETAFINSLTTGLGKSSVKELLSKLWLINSNKDAIEKLSYLRDKGFRFYFSAVFHAFNSPKEKQDEILLAQFTTPEDIDKGYSQLHNLQETIEELKQYKVIATESDLDKFGTIGWDSGRLVFLARLSFDAGYITEQEAWDFIESANALARNTFNNWNDYAKSYIIGRALWGGKESANSGIISIAEYLQKLPNSPWVQMRW